MSGKLRIDVVGQNEFSQGVDVDTTQVVSSIKVDVINRTVTVYYKRKEDGKPLTLSELEEENENENSGSEVTAGPVNEVATPDEPALLGVVEPVVSEDEAKADAHTAGDSEGTSGTLGASGEPNVVISGGTPTVDGKKPTTRGKRSGNTES